MNSKSEAPNPKRIGRKELKDLKEKPAPFSLRSLRSLAAKILCLLSACFAYFEVPASAAVFTNNLTLSETNAAYDGQDIVISGATLTVDGPHAFNSLPLTHGAVLTHSPCTASATHRLAPRMSRETAIDE